MNLDHYDSCIIIETLSLSVCRLRTLTRHFTVTTCILSSKISLEKNAIHAYVAVGLHK